MPASLSRVSNGSIRFSKNLRVAISLIAVLLLPGIGRLRQATHLRIGASREQGVAAIATTIPRGIQIARDRSNPADGRWTSPRHAWLAASRYEWTDVAAAVATGASHEYELAAPRALLCGYRATAPPAFA